MTAAEIRRVRRSVLACLGLLGRHLRAASDAIDSPNPRDARAHLLGARAAITDTLDTLEFTTEARS
jgi:hypothetical protein